MSEAPPRDDEQPLDDDRDHQAPQHFRPLVSSPRRWQDVYARRLAVVDLVALAFATSVAVGVRFGFERQAAAPGLFELNYVTVSAAIIAMWWLALTFSRSREPRILGEGTDEYRRVVQATFFLFGWIAILSLLFKWDLSRGYLAAAIPLGLASLLLSRKLVRTQLIRQRTAGKNFSKVLVIGGPRSAKRVTATLDDDSNLSYRVTGVWVPDRAESFNEWLDVPARFIPVLGTNRSLADALTISDADAVIVTDTEHLGHDGLRSLAWELEGVDVDLMVSPNVIDVSGPRIHLRAVANMPLLHLEKPQYAGASRLGKAIFDRTMAAGLLTMLLPAFAMTAAAIKATSPGKVFYRSERIGVGGKPFAMLKFRTMVTGADAKLDELLPENEHNGPLFKMKADPRVTSVGRFLRRYSIDELPQLLNVVRGEMSIVGPRPPLRREVEQYGADVNRRLLVKQGITGLWQVSGRSDLSWDESVRLDLDYVENWSMVRDLQIIWRTVKAVTNGRGAY